MIGTHLLPIGHDEGEPETRAILIERAADTYGARGEDGDVAASWWLAGYAEAVRACDEPDREMCEDEEHDLIDRRLADAETELVQRTKSVGEAHAIIGRAAKVLAKGSTLRDDMTQWLDANPNPPEGTF